MSAVFVYLRDPGVVTVVQFHQVYMFAQTVVSIYPTILTLLLSSSDSESLISVTALSAVGICPHDRLMVMVVPQGQGQTVWFG